MKNRLARRLAVLALVVLVSACVPLAEGVTVTNVDTSAPVQVTLTDGGGGLRSGPYTIQGVPKGTYNVVSGASAPYTHTVLAGGVPVNDTETIDIDPGNVQ